MIQVPKQYVKPLIEISAMSEANFDILIKALDDLPLTTQRHMLESSFKKWVGDNPLFEGVGAAVIGLGSLLNLNSGYTEGTANDVVKALQEDGNDDFSEEKMHDRLKTICDHLVSAMAMEKAQTAQNIADGMRSVSGRASIVPLSDLMHAKKPVAVSVFTMRIEYGGTSDYPAETAVIDMDLNDVIKLRAECYKMIRAAEAQEHLTADQYSFMKQNQYGIVE